jgi:hypothetical protein
MITSRLSRLQIKVSSPTPLLANDDFALYFLYYDLQCPQRETETERERERDRERDVFLCGTGVNLCELPVSFTKRKFLHGHPEMQKQRNAR